MTLPPAALDLLREVNAFAAQRRADEAIPASRDARIAALVAEINASRDQDTAAALACQLRTTINEDEPAPVQKTAEELKAQAAIDESNYFQLISKNKVPLREKEVTA